MTTAEAIRQLRQTLGKLQEDFAPMVGTSGATVSRWEHGRQPTRHYLRKLAEVAKTAGEDHLAMVFAAARQADFVAKVKNLPSPNSSRRIPVRELKAWITSLTAIVANTQHVGTLVSSGELQKDNPNFHKNVSDAGLILTTTSNLASRTEMDIDQYVDPPKRVIWEELRPETQATMLAPPDAEKTNADIQAIRRRNKKCGEQEAKQIEGSTGSKPPKGTGEK